MILAVTIAGVAMAADQQANPDKAGLYQAFIAKLAANLGVDQDKVNTALEATKKQMLDEAVADGKLTQEQADKMAARKDGLMGWFGGMHDRKGMFGVRMGKNSADMAAAIGITEDQLKSELASGKKLSDILADQGITEEQFQQKMLEIRKEALAQAVADGKLTQDQADKMLQRMEKPRQNPPSVTTDN
jgi:polyhydroxyalkanoate synthesis regulator phasin